MPGAGESISTEVLMLTAVILGEVVLMEEEEVGKGLSWFEHKVATSQFKEVGATDNVFFGVGKVLPVEIQFALSGVSMLMLLMVIWGCLISLGAPGASGFSR